MKSPVDLAFTQALPKAELHAHLTGSISIACLHEIWERKPLSKTAANLEDPLVACRPAEAHHDIFSFFRLFDTYIYELCNDQETVAFATKHVLDAFEADGVRYLELRTTPREALSTGLTKDIYVKTVLDAIERYGREKLSTYLILSIDRRNTPEQALQVVELALKYKGRGVVGIDLCGNPLKGDITVFQEAFSLAKEHGFKITLHFAEMSESSSDSDLRTLLSYRPDRIGHVIHVAEDIEQIIERQKLGLELCLSCNVHAKMTTGGFSDHHFGKWYDRAVPIALCTDDVGVFGSPLSNEYLLAATHFNLNRQKLVDLCHRAAGSIFGGEDEQARYKRLLDAFTESDDELN